MTRPGRDGEVIRSRILTSGREIFSQFQYSDVTGLQICEHAGVTRGALQHHFGSKLGLFMAVFEGLQHEVYLLTVDAIKRKDEPWQRIRAGITAFLDACTQPAYQMVVLKEGPAAIGWERWRELDADYYGNLTREFAATLAPAGASNYTSTMVVATMRGALAEMCFTIAESDDPVTARHEALTVIDKLLYSFRPTPPPTPANKPKRTRADKRRDATDNTSKGRKPGERATTPPRRVSLKRLREATS
ncbi:TetR/AcrR family transcriptional regulator [Mycobacterium sp. 1245801.1]|uniref:TetR/AcrR family transcriptional regulator n=1 Tax=Mycobacterium sp. 1245801.1 TaxID=1834075 RepID=UPI0009F1BBC2|nr:TetR/AcrR family transcriptional regulator [Mycobacterium sp. 1245801.1]